MSTPLGPVDPNRLALSRAGRQAQRQRQQQQQERARIEEERREEERRIQEERERLEAERRRREERRATAAIKAEVAARERTREEARQRAQEFDPIAEFQRLQEEGKIEAGDVLTTRANLETGEIEIRARSPRRGSPITQAQQIQRAQAERRAMQGPTEQELVQNLAQRAQTLESIFGERVPFGFAIQRGRGGQPAGFTGTLSIPDLSFEAQQARQAARSESINIFHRDFKAAQQFERDVQNAEMSVGTPSQRIGLRPSSPLAFEQKSDMGFFGTTTVQRQTRQTPVFFSDPTNPWNISTEPPREITQGTRPFFDLPATDDPIAGFTGVFRNVGEFAASGAGAIREPTFAPEVEASVFGAGLNAFTRFIQSQPAALQLTLASKEFGEIGQFAQQRPAFFAGSLIGSAAFFGATLGTGPAIKGGISGARAVGQARGLSSLEKSIKTLVPDAFGFSTARSVEGSALAITKTGRIIRRTGKTPPGTALFDVGTETAEGAFTRGIINVPKREVTFVTREPLAGEALEKAAGPAKFITQIGAKETTGLRRTLVKGEDILDLATKESLPKTVKSAVPNMPIFSKSPVIRFERTAFEGLPRPARPPVDVATAITYESGDILKFARATTKEPKKPLRGSEIDRMLGLPPRKSKPFDFAEQTTETIAPRAREKAIEGLASDLLSTPAARSREGTDLAKFISPATSTAESLGFRGETGQTRRGRRSVIEETGESIIAFPPGTRISPLARTLQRGLPSERTDFFQSTRSILDQSTVPRFDLGTRLDIGQMGRQAFRLDSAQSLRTTQAQTPLFRTGQLTRPLTAQTTRQAQRPIFDTPFRFPTPRTPRVPRTPPIPFINFGFDEPRPRKGKKGRRLRFSERVFPFVDPFAGTSFEIKF